MKKILITAPVRQDIRIFKEYLWSLNRLQVPEGYEIHKYFYLHNSGNLRKFLEIDEYKCVNDDTVYQYNDRTHIWKMENFKAVSLMRTMALEKARKENYDYVFSVDSDIILRKNTLIDLLEDDKEVVGKIWWTAYDKEQPWIIAPSCYDGRDTNGRMIVDNFRIKEIGIHEIGTICGCTLISRKIFENSYINYFPIKNLSSSNWEDFAFSTRTHIIFPDIKFYIDTRYPVKHLYRLEDYELWKKEEKEKWEKEY